MAQLLVLRIFISAIKQTYYKILLLIVTILTSIKNINWIVSTIGWKLVVIKKMILLELNNGKYGGYNLPDFIVLNICKF